MEARDVFKKLRAIAATEHKLAVATVVRAYGSTPREVGAKMVILENGDFFGTVGGGCGEAEVWHEAKRVLGEGVPRTVHVDLTEDPLSGGEKICGGKMDIFIDLWDRNALEAVGGIVDLLAQGKGLTLATVVDAPADSPARPGARLRVDDGGVRTGSLGAVSVDTRLEHEAPRLLASRRSCVIAVPADPEGPLAVPAPRHATEGAVEVFVEVLESPPLLVIAGAGHCALPLARMGSMLGFEIVILDDRPDCATAERFPDAARILLGDLEQEIRRVPATPNTYLVLVTRGHRQDEQILRQVAREPLGYIGMIGSRRRIRAVFDDMTRDGYEADVLARVHAPIGLDIGAQSPEEIAIAILAEIVMVRKGGTGGSMRSRPS